MPIASVNNADAPGWFGKIPNVGDFASRRLPEAFVRRWDRWLQRGLVAARSTYGAAWLDGYLVAPVRRFWLGPGVVDKLSWAGLLMPSVDGVGRHFPLTLAQPRVTLADALVARDWYRALDATARQVLDVEFSIEDFERALAQTMLAGMAAASDDAAGASSTAAGQLSGRLLEACPDGRASVWWCGDAADEAPFQCFKSLPSAAALAAMLVESR